MKLFCATSLLALTSLAAPALALDIGGGFSLIGNLEYERLDSGSSGANIAFLDADLSYLHSSGFGGFIGVDSISVSTGDTAEALYGALSYSGDFGRIEIGAPRSVINDYVVTPEIGTADFLDFTLAQFSGPFLPFIFLTTDETAIGLRYDGTFGATSVGLSYHKVDSASVISAAMSYGFDNGKLMASIEHLSDSGNSGTRFLIGGEYSFGQVTTGLLVSNDDGITDATAVKGYVVYSATDRLDLTASVLTASVGGSDLTIYGLGATYDLSDDLYAEVGYVGGDGVIGGGDVFTLAVGVNF